jgi:hypothetical protein
MWAVPIHPWIKHHLFKPETPAQRIARLKAELAEAEAELRREEMKTIPF